VIGLDAVSYGENAEQAARWREQVRRRFFATFAPEGQTSLDQNTIPQALSLINGGLTNGVLAPARNPFMAELLEIKTPDAKLDALFLRVVGRPATKSERRALSMRNMASDEQLVFLQDVLWALLNSSEFTFNH
jgi:hypothetical protein